MERWIYVYWLTCAQNLHLCQSTPHQKMQDRGEKDENTNKFQSQVVLVMVVVKIMVGVAFLGMLHIQSWIKKV